MPPAQFELCWFLAGLKEQELVREQKGKERLLLYQKLGKTPIPLPRVRAAIQFTRSACKSVRLSGGEPDLW